MRLAPRYPEIVAMAAERKGSVGKLERNPPDRRSRSPPVKMDVKPIAAIPEPITEQFSVDREKVRCVLILIIAHLISTCI